jgi:deoxyribose-phosphate aldolase
MLEAGAERIGTSSREEIKKFKAKLPGISF